MKTRRNIICASLLLVSMLAEPLVAAEQQNMQSAQRIKNFMKSLLIPGWGQLSEDHTIRAGIFVAAEITAIASYASLHRRGQSLESDYKAFAAEHWDFAKWLSNDDGDQACGYIRTHQMPYTIVGGEPIPYRDHHYYENIGKYPEFICGWDDWNSRADEIHLDGGQIYTLTMKDYIEIRTSSNEAYRASRVALTLTMVNHLVSAFEAAAGTSLTTYTGDNFSAQLYINPVMQRPNVQLEVRF